METVLVTGANGYIGRHIITELVSRDVNVIALDIDCSLIKEKVCKIETSIFEDEELINRIGKVDRCIHLAWKDGFVHNSDAHMTELGKHYSFIKKICLTGIKSISIMGTMHEIGYWEGAIDENTPTNPLSMYGIAKNSLRLSSKLLAFNEGVSWKWLRAFYIVGDDAKNHSVFAKIIQAEKEGKKEFPFNSGKILYDFISVDDLAKQIVSASLQDEICGEINCCSGKPVSLAEKTEEFLLENNFKIKLNYGSFPDREYDSPGIWGDVSKIEKILEKK